jgi:hypothetical protein
MAYEPKTGGYIHRQLITEVEQNMDSIVAIMEVFNQAAASLRAKELINEVLALAYKNQRALARMTEIVGARTGTEAGTGAEAGTDTGSETGPVSGKEAG